MKKLAIFIMVALLGTFFVNQVNAQQGTFVLWRVNDAVPGEEMEVSISNDNVNIYTYTFVTPDDVKQHPFMPDMKFYDFTKRLPVTLSENEMAIMCIRPADLNKDEYQCTEIFVTNNMARGIMYNSFEEEPGYHYT